MCVNKLSKVVLDSAAPGIEPATSSRKSNALTTAPHIRILHLFHHKWQKYIKGEHQKITLGHFE